MVVMSNANRVLDQWLHSTLRRILSGFRYDPDAGRYVQDRSEIVIAMPVRASEEPAEDSGP